MIRMLFMIFFIFISGCATKHEFKFIYHHGHKFDLPRNFTHLVSFDTNDNLLIFKYSNDPGKKYISISEEKNIIKTHTEDCTYSIFFAEVLNKSKSNFTCEDEEVNSFRFVFMQNAEAGLWNNIEHNYYYFIREDKSNVFIVKDDIILNLSSDFLTKNEWKKLLKLN